MAVVDIIVVGVVVVLVTGGLVIPGGAGGGEGVSWGLLRQVLLLESRWSSGKQAMLPIEELGVDVEPEVTCGDDDVGN